MYTIDRIEEGWAVLQNDREETVTLPLSQLPAGVRPGDVINEESGAYTVDSEATQSRRKRILALQNRLRKK